ncbi:hypothetical protein [Virgibacillus proomii]|uniref:hypothetical protein n=1 Tax=Virgibacillus proomii TaxID=84407 RepID=UPI001C107C3C|nr:hypothetical protein [Virgibacillus proomii]MBU5265504.1 hypothetical protein [Virgibacillus proomii]
MDFESDVGIETTGFVDAKLMKAILNTDGFVLSRRSGRHILEKYNNHSIENIVIILIIFERMGYMKERQTKL